MRLALMRLRFGYDDVKIANYSRQQLKIRKQQETQTAAAGAAAAGAQQDSQPAAAAAASGAVNLRQGLLSGTVLPSSTPLLTAAELASATVRASLARQSTKQSNFSRPNAKELL